MCVSLSVCVCVHHESPKKPVPSPCIIFYYPCDDRGELAGVCVLRCVCGEIGVCWEGQMCVCVCGGRDMVVWGVCVQMGSLCV